jgi:hypothetical protein
MRVHRVILSFLRRSVKQWWRGARVSSPRRICACVTSRNRRWGCLTATAPGNRSPQFQPRRLLPQARGGVGANSDTRATPLDTPHIAATLMEASGGWGGWKNSTKQQRPSCLKMAPVGGYSPPCCCCSSCGSPTRVWLPGARRRGIPPPRLICARLHFGMPLVFSWAMTSARRFRNLRLERVTPVEGMGSARAWGCTGAQSW